MRRLDTWLVVSFSLACGLLASLSCGERGAPVAASSPTGGSGGSISSYGTSACGMCVESACATEWGACAGDPSCAAYLDCLSACPLGPGGDADSACEAACPAITSSAGQTAKMALDACRSAGSGVMCFACGKIPAPMDPIYHQVCGPPPAKDQMNACWTCEDQNCCDTHQACHDNPDCEALLQCVQACGLQSVDCWHQCYAMHPAAFPALEDLLTCTAYFCRGATICVASNPCFDCFALHCADEMAACARDLQCTLLSDCESACGTDLSCDTSCEAMFPQSAVDLLHSFVDDCGVKYCTSECGGTG